jgi:hypothetical protein
MTMKFLPVPAICLVLAACSAPLEPLTVKQFTLRDQEMDGGSDPMVRNEKLRRLHGAVSLEERKQRLGQYYTVLWYDPKTVGFQREIVFRYQQGGSASRIKEMRRTIPAGTSEGKEEFSIIGDNYFNNGRVLAWKIDFTAGGQTIASKQSYLWE